MACLGLARRWRVKERQAWLGAERLGWLRLGAYVLFVIQMADVRYLHPNDGTDPGFGAALREAAACGVHILAMDCAVTEDSMAIRKPVPVRL